MAQREFHEETGFTSAGPYVELTPVQQRGGKTVMAWAFRGDCDPFKVKPNTFSMEWPRGSGRPARVPRDRLRRVLHARRRPQEAEPRPGRVRRRADGAARGETHRTLPHDQPALSDRAAPRAQWRVGTRRGRSTPRHPHSGWLRAKPGTISLGQGIVSYGPPAEPFCGWRRSGASLPSTGTGQSRASRKCSPSSGTSSDRERLTSRRQPGRRHGRRQHGVPERRAGDHRSRRRGDPADAVLLQPRDGRRDGGVPRRWRATDALSARSRRSRAAITTRTRAIVTISPNNPTGAVYPKRICAR